jgi:hypothetical protein
MTSVNDFQLRQMFCSILGLQIDDYDNCDGVDEFFARLRDEGRLRLPDDAAFYLIPERVAIFAAITKANSWLMQQLMDRPQDAALVADAIGSGKTGLYFVKLVSDLDTARLWFEHMMWGNTMNFTIRPVRSEFVVVVSLLSFVGGSDFSTIR